LGKYCQGFEGEENFAKERNPKNPPSQNEDGGTGDAAKMPALPSDREFGEEIATESGGHGLSGGVVGSAA
jgi:hypothetical protein